MLRRSVDRVGMPKVELKTKYFYLLEAAEYYNSCIYRDLIYLCELGPNPFVYPVSPAHIQNGATRPDHLQLSFICIVLSHRANRMGQTLESGDLAETYYQYRGMAIRSLNDDLDEEHKRTSNIVIAGIITLLLTDAQQGDSRNWRCHLQGIHKVIALRGGLRALVGAQNLESMLLCLMFISIMANTTSPASDLANATSHLAEIDLILEGYGKNIFAFQMCPSSLFGEIIKINHLRMRATTDAFVDAGDLTSEAYRILSRLDDFSLDEWALSKPSAIGEWMLLGEVYHAAVTIYCISSLQSLSVLPPSSALRARCLEKSQTLQALLSKALVSPIIKRAMLWPLTVLGVEAVHGGVAMRAFIQNQLPELSCYAGVYAPLMAKCILERFWASGGTRWDACFDRPYAFAMQIAVDVSRISSSN
ncbi:hypothetical protein AB5N19_10686 [Seiridium cardinale]|uniref:Uncharacterized protein n=1 Tax=Seiridium cardinale TaxID=138064 RepID=A0ABR2XSM0_9PEZI